MTRAELRMAAQLFGLALVVRFVTCISFVPAAFAGDALLPAVFLRLDISVSAGLLA